MYKILLADDEGIVLDSLKFIISKNFGESCIIRTAKSGRQVIELSQEFVPDIAFVDIQMPGIKGIDAIREVRTFNKKCQFIIMSAYDKFQFAQEAINLGVIEYLTKPASREKIVATLEKAMKNIDLDRSKRSQDLMIREKLEAVVPLIENGFINQLLFQEDFAPYLDRYQELLNFHEDYGWIMTLEYGDSLEDGTMENPVGSTVHLQKYHLAFREIIKEFFPTSIIGPVMASHVSVFIPHKASEISYEERIHDIESSRNMVRKLKKQIDLKFRCGIGNLYPITEQNKSYEESTRSLRADNKSSVVHLKDIKMELEYEPDYPADLEAQLFDSVRKGDSSNAGRIANQFFDWMLQNYSDYPQSIRTKALEFVIWAERELFLKGAVPYGFLCRKDYLDTILACSTYEELRHWYLRKIGDAADKVSQAKEEKETSLIGKAKQYIQQNFSKELPLEEVSRYVDLSPYYFTKLFKEETGQTFVEYLTELRIRRAKEMLRNPSSSIKEICIEAGYSDPNYFSRIFKKVTGMTPTEYREENGR